MTAINETPQADHQCRWPILVLADDLRDDQLPLRTGGAPASELAGRPRGEGVGVWEFHSSDPERPGSAVLMFAASGWHARTGEPGPEPCGTCGGSATWAIRQQVGDATVTDAVCDACLGSEWLALIRVAGSDGALTNLHASALRRCVGGSRCQAPVPMRSK